MELRLSCTNPSRWHNSSALAMELRLSCTNPSRCAIQQGGQGTQHMVYHEDYANGSGFVAFYCWPILPITLPSHITDNEPIIWLYYVQHSVFVAFFCVLVWVDITNILWGYFTGNGAIIWLPWCQWCDMTMCHLRDTSSWINWLCAIWELPSSLVISTLYKDGLR